MYAIRRREASRCPHLVKYLGKLAKVGQKGQRLSKGYLKPRLDQADDPTCWQRDVAMGSGAAESAGKRPVAQPAKGPGMHWIAEGLEVVPALRSISLNRDWHAFWKTDPQRAAA